MVTKCTATIAAGRSAESSMNTSFTSCLLYQPQMPSFYKSTTVETHLTKPSTKELIGDYCSQQRPGRGTGVIHSLPFRHFPTTIPVDDPTQKSQAQREVCTLPRQEKILC